MFKKIDETSYPEKLPRAVADIIRLRWTPLDSGPIATIGDDNENNRPDTRSERRMAGRHLQAKQRRRHPGRGRTNVRQSRLTLVPRRQVLWNQGVSRWQVFET